MAQKRSKRPTADAPRAAANYVRRSANSIRAHGERVGEPINLAQAERIALRDWANLNDKKISFRFVDQFKPIGSGAEHRVYHDEKNRLAVKATRTNSFGHSVYARDLLATPSEYLRRLAWSNLLLGDEFRILGVAFDEEQIEIVSAHKWIEGNKDRSVPFADEITEYFRRFGFKPVGNNPDAPLFYHDGFQLLLADAHDTNIIRSVNGKCAAIDVVIGNPGPRLRAELGLSGLAISGHTSVIGAPLKI
jgi:Serine/Threonine/Tyrosine Kinase found in polyvalent proteins